MTPETYARYAYPGAETVLSLLDEKGTVVESFGFPEMPSVFFDRKARGRRRLTGNTGDPTQKLREISVPLPAAVRFLYFYRSELTLASQDEVTRPELQQQYVALYSTARPGERSLEAPPLPIPATRPVRPAPLPWLPARRRPE